MLLSSNSVIFQQETSVKTMINPEIKKEDPVVRGINVDKKSCSPKVITQTWAERSSPSDKVCL